MATDDPTVDGVRVSRPDDVGVRLSELQGRFRRNVSSATRAWTKHVADEAVLAGMTADEKAAARERARTGGLGGFTVSLDAASYEAVVRHANDRSLRKEVYEAHVTRASDRGPLAGHYDNGPVIDEILALRYELSRGLGFVNYAEAALRTNGLSSTEEVDHFLIDLNRRTRPRAQSELEEVWRFARSQGAPKEFRPWDLPYWSDKLRQSQLGTVRAEADGGVPAGLATAEQIELALFDLRLHRDYVPEGRSSSLRSQVLDTLAQVRREVSVLPPPPWNRTPNHLVDVFGGDDAVHAYASVWGAVLSGSSGASLTRRAPRS
jgi:Zn-dependent oligopeptidase